MTDLVKVQLWTPLEIKFSNTVFGKVFADCIEGKVANYGVCDTTGATVSDYIIDFHARELMEKSKVTYQYSQIASMKYMYTFSNFKRFIKVMDNYQVDPYTNQQRTIPPTTSITYELADDDVSKVSLYCIEHIGIPILHATTIYKKLLIGSPSSRETGCVQMQFSTPTNDNVASWLHWEKLYADVKLKSPLYKQTSQYRPPQCNVKVAASDLHRKSINRILWYKKVSEYYTSWMTELAIQLEKKRNEIYTSLGNADDYDKKISALVSAAVEEEANAVGCESNQLPHFTVDSIIRTIRKENPRPSASDDLHLICMKQLAPYVAASCKGFIKTANKFLVESDE